MSGEVVNERMYIHGIGSPRVHAAMRIIRATVGRANHVCVVDLIISCTSPEKQNTMLLNNSDSHTIRRGVFLDIEEPCML
jgi:hypothetical protein